MWFPDSVPLTLESEESDEKQCSRGVPANNNVAEPVRRQSKYAGHQRSTYFSELHDTVTCAQYEIQKWMPFLCASLLHQVYAGPLHPLDALSTPERNGFELAELYMPRS